MIENKYAEKRPTIETIREQFLNDIAEEAEIREEAKIDIEFRTGEQWDPVTKQERKASGKPALTCDRTHVFINSVANEARQNKPQGKVNPLGGGASTDVANVINGILRHIKYRSKGDVANDVALDSSAGSSFGYLRAISEWTPKSFDQELRIVPVIDPFSVYGVLIPYCRGLETDHAFVVSSIPKKQYVREFGANDSAIDWEAPEWKTNDAWIKGENVIVAEYWYVIREKHTLREIQGPDGSILPIYTDDEAYRDDLKFVLDEKGQPKEREDECARVYFCTVDGRGIREGSDTEWVGDSIPIVPVIGQQITVEGKVHLFSLIRFVRDTQRLINIYESAIAEKIALSNKVPYIGYAGQFTDKKWKNAHVVNYPYLEAALVLGPNREVLPLPERQQLEEQIAALSNALRTEIDNMKAGMGIFDASLGNQGNETSGVGIQSRQQQSNVTNFHFADNLNRAIWDLDLKLLKAIPKIYDRPGRQVRIVGEDQVHSVVVVNQQYKDPDTGAPRHYPLDTGDYDIVETTGPSYTTARAEAADTLQQFFKVAPQAVPLLADLWVGSLDYPWSREAARRLKLAAPQNIVNEQDSGQQQIPPAVAQHLQDLTAQHAQLVQTVHVQAQEIESKKFELDSRERIAAMQEETKRTIALAQLNADAGGVMLEQEIAALNQKYDLIAQHVQQSRDHAHEASLQAADQQHQAAMAQQAQAAQPGADAGPEEDDADLNRPY
jgi:portal protein